MAHYQLQLLYGDNVVVDTTVAWSPDGGSHPVVGQTADGKWRVVEILDSTAQVYRVRVEPLTFLTESAL
jgi:hypothetical protein